MKETQEYKGYRIKIQQDIDAENPFEAWDCEPPLIVHGLRGHSESYQGAPESMGEIVSLMPEACFSRGQRVPLIKATLNCSMREFVEVVREYGDVRDAFAQLATEQVGRVPEGWRSALEWMEMAEALLTWGGIACHQTQSNGYSQGDSILLLAIATPEWVAKVGAPADSLQGQLEGACDLYGAWAWGDVYGVSEIRAPGEDEDDDNGEEIEGASCWGFYGRDHEKSGLMEHSRSVIDYRINELQQIALGEPACLI